MLELAVKTRKELRKKAKLVLNRGSIPAILYGYGIQPKPLEVESRAFEKALKMAGETSLVSLAMDDGSRNTVLIYDVSCDVLRGVPTHIDFYAVRMDRELDADVPLVFTGEADAVKSLNGVLVKVLHKLSIRALPKDLPHEIVVDISPLVTLGDQIFVKNIQMPNGVDARMEPDQVVVLVEAPRSEEELAAMEQPAEVSLENIEIAGKKEKEVETEEGEAGSVEETNKKDES
ncbi:MAG: large subunit ribosomal protein L25 [Parcubacteria group bacterium Gr01-1014_70]|nr:MAG: large subunit ribosomal protein L25 [Parcubacteria group bacterium Gr01-1014_70]